jgi:hypothetical protein
MSKIIKLFGTSISDSTIVVATKKDIAERNSDDYDNSIEAMNRDC